MLNCFISILLTMGKNLIHLSHPYAGYVAEYFKPGTSIWISMVLDSIVRYIPDVFRDRERNDSCDGNYCSSDPEPGYPDRKRRKVTPSQLAVCPIVEHSVSQILGWLLNDNVDIVGVCGMGGIGKTFLAQQVYARLQAQYSDYPYFDNVDRFTAISWVTVGLQFTVVELQQKIAEGFGLDLRGDKDVVRRAALLNALLSRIPNCILFLDDLWEYFRREDVGIPKHCKLIITSRSSDVCRIMRCQKLHRVEPLPEEQALQLFLHTVGDIVQLQHHKEIEETVKLLCYKCGGVPLAISVLAKSMKGVVEVSRWRRALEDFDEYSNKLTHLGDMLTVLMKSYDKLNNTKLKKCFVLCALYPPGNAISREELIHLWIRQGLIDDALPLQTQFDMGHTILNKLRNSSLLEEIEDNRGLRIHDLVRDMAIYISNEGVIK